MGLGHYSSSPRGCGRGHSCHGGRSTHHSNNNGGRSSTGSSSTHGPPRLSCQICNKVGHSTVDCYHRMDFAYQGRHPPAQLTAMVASQSLAMQLGTLTVARPIILLPTSIISLVDLIIKDLIKFLSAMVQVCVFLMLCQALFLLLLLNFVFQIRYMSLTLQQI